MADEPQRRLKPRRAEGENGRPRRPDPRRIVGSAVEQLQELTGRPVTGVIGFGRGDHGWEVQAEVLELERVPETMSILACYEITVDEHGHLRGYQRLRRYARSQIDEG
jgi:hypothetical protein